MERDFIKAIRERRAGKEVNRLEAREFDQCIKRIRNGDRNGLKEIYDAYAGYLFHLVLAITRNREDAEDVTSEVFIRIWEQAESYVPGSGHKGWLAAIARNMSVDFLRKNRREIPDEMGGQMEEYAAAPDESEKLLSDLSVAQTLERLNTCEREVIHLKIIGDMTFREISSILSVPMGTVTWRYRQAVEKLRRYGYEA